MAPGQLPLLAVGPPGWQRCPLHELRHLLGTGSDMPSSTDETKQEWLTACTVCLQVMNVVTGCMGALHHDVATCNAIMCLHSRVP